MRVTDLVEDYLVVWVLAAVGLGVVEPRLAGLTRYSTVILAVMIGSISLTLSPARFRRVDGRALGLILVGHATMPGVAYVVARALGLSPAVTAGFVVLGAVTPELVTPVMTDLAGGDTALSATALVATGVGSVAFVPAAVSVFAGGVGVAPARIVEQLLVAVVAPMAAAVGARAWRPDRVGRFDPYYPAVSAVMVVLIIGGVTGANAAVLRSNATLVATVGVGAAVLNAYGYVAGFLLGRRADRPTRVASTLSVGMRDFAVAAALVVAAGLPAVASLPAVTFGVVEMVSSAGLAGYASRR